MCTYITAVLPEGTDKGAAAKVFDRHKHGFEILEKAPPAVGREDLYVLTTRKHCDCGTALGSGADRVEERKNPLDEVPQLRKKGWSETKIQRWLSDKLNPPQRAEPNREEELARWEAFIRDVLETGVAPSLGLFVHFYNERFEDDIIRHVERVPLSQLTTELLLNMRDDTLYIFLPGRWKRA